MHGMDLKNHFSLASSQSVQEICNPLLHSIGITYFNYIKIYNNDCSRELLTNNPDWIDHFYINALYNSIGAVNVEHLLPKGYFLWSEMDIKDPVYLRGRDFFNIDNGISFVIKRNDVTYLYIFGSNLASHEMDRFYTGNIDLLQRFIHYFNDQGQTIIKTAESNRIYLPKPQSIDANHSQITDTTDNIRKLFFDRTKIKRYYLLNESDNLYLTTKQAQCAALLTQGLTSKQIARVMGISHRTIEGYFLDIKNKIQDEKNQTINKEQLIKILRSSNLQ